VALFTIMALSFQGGRRRQRHALCVAPQRARRHRPGMDVRQRGIIPRSGRISRHRCSAARHSCQTGRPQPGTLNSSRRWGRGDVPRAWLRRTLTALARCPSARRRPDLVILPGARGAVRPFPARLQEQSSPQAVDRYITVMHTM
jgi:hypothetical protein